MSDLYKPVLSSRDNKGLNMSLLVVACSNVLFSIPPCLTLQYVMGRSLRLNPEATGCFAAGNQCS